MQTFSSGTQGSNIMSTSLLVLDNSSPTRKAFNNSLLRQWEFKLNTYSLKRLEENSMMISNELNEEDMSQCHYC